MLSCAKKDLKHLILLVCMKINKRLEKLMTDPKIAIN